MTAGEPASAHARTFAIAVVLGALLAAFVLFVSGALTPDLVALLVLAALLISGVIAPAQAYAGFSSFGRGAQQHRRGRPDRPTLVTVLGRYGPLVVLAGVVVRCMILTQPICDGAVAIIMTPIVINTAGAMDANPRAFCIGVIVACPVAGLPGWAEAERATAAAGR